MCDGKNDCPFGEDELSCDIISDCKDMYRCRESKQCIHLNNICDNYTDCMHGDDERKCTLHGVGCPIGCVCFENHCLLFTLTHFGPNSIHESEVENVYALGWVS